MSEERTILNRVAIERLKKIESRATPGPWTNCEYQPNRIEAQAQTCPDTGPSICNIIYNDDYSDRQYADAKLITALRNNAIPLLEELSAENERLRKELEALQKSRDEQEEGELPFCYGCHNSGVNRGGGDCQDCGFSSY